MKQYLFLIGIFISLSLFSQDYSQVYLIGGATPNGWQNDKAEAMTLVHADDNNVVFAWSGTLTKGDFKFINALNTWQPSFNASTENEEVQIGSVHNLVYNEAGNDYKFIITQAGVYKITVDLKQMTMMIESQLEDLWISGSAIPDSPVKLIKTYSGGFVYGGELLRGELKIQTTEQIGDNTRFLVPVEEYADITGETTFRITDDATIRGWDVTVDDPVYKIKIDFSSKKATTAVILPSDNLYMVGGACEAGWDAGNAIGFIQDAPGVFVFNGELKVRTENVESNMFKILCQRDWNPNSLHPISENEQITNASYYVESINGSYNDWKWMIDDNQQGTYIIKVNIFTETIETQFIGEGTGIAESDNSDLYHIYSSSGSISVELKDPDTITVIALSDISGRLIETVNVNTTPVVLGGNLPNGVYVVSFRYASRIVADKVLIH